MSWPRCDLKLPPPHEINNALLLYSTAIVPKVNDVGGSKPAIAAVPLWWGSLRAPVFLWEDQLSPESTLIGQRMSRALSHLSSISLIIIVKRIRK
jgi:hypothetical protein